MNYLSTRFMYLYAFFGGVLMMVLALYLQFIKGIAPCPLCVLQRLCLVLLCVCFLIGAGFSLKRFGNIFIGVMSLIISLSGIFLSGRQVWLQHLPPNKTADCGVSLQYLMSVLPLHEVFKKILQGTADCAQLEWSLWNFSLAEWSLFWFVFFAIFALLQMVRRDT